MYLRAFAFFFLIAIAVDSVVFHSEYRRHVAYGFSKAWSEVKHLHWTGFLGR